MINSFKNSAIQHFENFANKESMIGINMLNVTNNPIEKHALVKSLFQIILLSSLACRELSAF